MSRLLAVAAVALVGLTAAADDKPKPAPADPKLKGTWVREVNGLTLSFTFKTKTELLVTVGDGSSNNKLTCKYELTDGKVAAEVTAVDKEGDAPPVPVGFKFKFKITPDGDAAKVTDFDSDHGDAYREMVEGDYKRKKADRPPAAGWAGRSPAHPAPATSASP